MTAKEFYDTVVKMRRYQKEFERSGRKDHVARHDAIKFEKIIDTEIVRVTLLEKERMQPRLEL